MATNIKNVNRKFVEECHSRNVKVLALILGMGNKSKSNLNAFAKEILDKYKDCKFPGGLALSSGIPPQVVMKWTGHSDYKAMKPYINIAERTKADAMKVIEDAWSR